MKIIGCDFHPSFQQIAMVDTRNGRVHGTQADAGGGAAVLRRAEGPVLVGMEACGNTLWFERLLARLGHELRLGDAAKIRAMEVRKQKTDRRDAAAVAAAAAGGSLSASCGCRALEQRDVRQLLLHRHKLVAMRRQVKNELQHLALNQGVQQKRKLWSAAGRQRLEELPLTGWTAQRRAGFAAAAGRAGPPHCEAGCGGRSRRRTNDAVARLLRTHPGVGPITALAFSLTLGKIERFARSRQVVSYLGLNPAEHSSGGRQRLGAISKQGNPMLRSLLVEAGQSAARSVPELKRAYQRLKHRKHSGVAKVMVARKLAVRLYWMWKTQQPYAAARTQGSPSHPWSQVKTGHLSGHPASRKSLGVRRQESWSQ